MKVLYFTATGNSLHVAKSIGGELLSIPQLIRNEEYDIKDDVVGLVYPVYHSNLPEPVEQYLLKANIECNYCFVIGTYGSVLGNGVKRGAQLLKTRGVKVQYTNGVLMYNNFIRSFDIETQLKIKNERQIEEEILHIVWDINDKVENFTPSLSKEYVIKDHDHVQLLIDDDTCNGCGICDKICPIDNIEIIDKKARFKEPCIVCLACLQACFQYSIHFEYQQGYTHYINKHVSVGEIIRSNRQK